MEKYRRHSRKTNGRGSIKNGARITKEPSGSGNAAERS